MNKKKRIVTSLVMSVLIAATWVWLYQQQCKQRTFDTILDKYEGMGRIEYVKVSDGDRIEILLWDGKFWRWEDNEHLSAPQDEVTDLVKKLMADSNPQKVEEEVSPEETGLDDSKYEVVLRDYLGNELTIRIGKSTPNGAYYATLDGELYTIRKHARRLADEIIIFRMMIDFDINSSPSYMSML